MLVIGAGPAGLFAAFQLRLFGIAFKLVEATGTVGGQCTAFYADKPIFDAPGFLSVPAGELVERLTVQAAVAPLDLLLQSPAVGLEADDGIFSARLSDGRALRARAVVLATGGGVVGKLAPLDGVASERRPNVETEGFATGTAGIFAIGDAAAYRGKLPLLASAFHEAALMTQAVRRLLAEQQPIRKSVRAKPGSSGT